MPAISVIVPVYKVEPYLRRCVDSILNQTFQDFELILVDDGSPDNCGAICDEYAAQDSRVHVIHQENGGLSAARNAGIDWVFANSNSEWLSFIDSDDWIHPQMLEICFLSEKQTNLSVVVTSFKRVAAESEIEFFPVDLSCTQILNTEEFFCQHNVAATVAWGKLYRKALFRNLRYPIGKVHEDEFLTYRVLFQTQQIAYIPQPMYWYYQNSASITRSSWNIRRLDKVQAFREQMEWFDRNHYEDAYHTRIRSYAWIIGESIKNLSESTIPKKHKYISHLRKELRIFLREKFTHVSPDSVEVKWIYQIAYPTEMKVHRFIRRKATAVRQLGFIGLIKKVFRKEDL